MSLLFIIIMSILYLFTLFLNRNNWPGYGTDSEDFDLPERHEENEVDNDSDYNRSGKFIYRDLLKLVMDQESHVVFKFQTKSDSD